MDKTKKDKAISEIMKKHGALFVFSGEQFLEGQKKSKEEFRGLPLSEYSDLGAGLICPEKNVEKLIKELDKV